MSAAVDPRCAGFRWADHKAASGRRLTAAQIERFDRDGACVVESAIPAETLAAVTAELDALEAQLPRTLITLEGETAYDYPRDAITFVKQPMATAPAVRDFLTSPLLGDIAVDIVGAPARLYWDQAVYKKPGRGPEFPWHQDNGYTFTEPLTYLTCWIPLSDASVEDGCPWIIPGAHRGGVYRHRRGDWGLEIEGVDDLLANSPAAAVPVKAGDIVAFSSLTPHRTGPNGTPRIRKALIVQYIADGARVVGEDGIWRPVNDQELNPLVGERSGASLD